MASKPQASKTASGVSTPAEVIEKYKAQVAAQSSAANYFELGTAYYVAGRWDDAVSTFEKSVGMDANQGFAYYYLGLLYAARGQQDKAQAALDRVLQVSNNPMLKELAKARIPNVKSLADLGAK